MATKWTTVRHDKTGHEHRVPDRPHVLADWARRGWKPPKQAAARSGGGQTDTKE